MVTITGCGQVGYYLQAANGQLDLLSKRESVQQLLEDPDTTSSLKQKLNLASEARKFAIQTMGLKGDPGFSQYADLGRQYAVWNVVAAPKYSIEAKTWCFPIAGCVAYKGFFNKDAALKEQQILVEQDYDVRVYGVAAYSTLGWFNDPLLNTFIHYSDTDLASLIFHEFAHQVVYVQDDSEFNEAFATAVELHVLSLWLEQYGDQQRIRQIREQRRKHSKVSKMILDFRSKLQIAYLKDNAEQEKLRIFSAMKVRYQELIEAGEGTPFFDWWFSRPLNNADLLTVSTYYRLVPAFTRLLARHQDNLTTFFSEVEELAKLAKSDRDLILSQLHSAEEL